MTEQRYLSLRQVQAELGLIPDELDQLLRSGRLPAFRVADHWRVDRRRLESMVEELTTECEALLRRESVFGARSDPPVVRPADLSTGGVPAQRSAQRSAQGSAEHAGHLGLTEQQQRIVRLLAEGMSNAEIAGRLSVEVSTVKSHVSRVLQRLDLRDREQLIAYVWRRGVMHGAP